MKFKNGFTLVEALALMAIAAIILAASMPIITKKHLRPQSSVNHGRYECWWNGNTLMERTIHGERILPDENGVVRPEGTPVPSRPGRPNPWNGNPDQLPQGTFVPPANVDKFLIQAVGGGGAGGGAGRGFINSKLVNNEGPTRNTFFQPVVVNGEPEVGKYNQGWGGAETSPSNSTPIANPPANPSRDPWPAYTDPWPTPPNWPLVNQSSSYSDQASVRAKRGGFVADGELRKLGYSTKQIGTPWFKWSYLKYGSASNSTTNNLAFMYVGVACSGGGGTAGRSIMTDDKPYYCLENQKRDTITEEFAYCSGSCSGNNSSQCSGIESGASYKQGCQCGDFYTPKTCTDTTTTTGKDGTTSTSTSTRECGWTTQCGCRTEYWERKGCTGKDGPWYKCPTSCQDEIAKISCGAGQMTPNCTKHVSDPEGSAYLFMPVRNKSQIATNVNGAGGGCGSFSGKPGTCTSVASSIIPGISSNVNEQGIKGDDSPGCKNAMDAATNCPARGAKDGQDAAVSITGGDYAGTKTCTAYGGGGGNNSNIPGEPSLETSLKNFRNSLSSTSQVTKAVVNPTNAPEGSKESKQVQYYGKNNKPLPGIGYITDQSVADWIVDWANAQLRAKYMCTCPGPKPSSAAYVDCNCVTVHGVTYCGPGGEWNYKYSWSRQYYTQWLAYGEAGQPGGLIRTYESKLSGNLTVNPGRGGEAGIWNSVNKGETAGEKGKPTTILSGTKEVLRIEGGDGGEGSIMTDEYTLCPGFMFNYANYNNNTTPSSHPLREPTKCATKFVRTDGLDTPQREIPGGKAITTTGLEKFHAVFDMKRSNMRIAGVENFGIGGEGQGSKSLCDSADDVRRVWTVAPATVAGHHIYDNRTSNGSITSVNGHRERCPASWYNNPSVQRNVYFRNGVHGATYDRSAPYAPQQGGHGAVIITW